AGGQAPGVGLGLALGFPVGQGSDAGGGLEREVAGQHLHFAIREPQVGHAVGAVLADAIGIAQVALDPVFPATLGDELQGRGQVFRPLLVLVGCLAVVAGDVVGVCGDLGAVAEIAVVLRDQFFALGQPFGVGG